MSLTPRLVLVMTAAGAAIGAGAVVEASAEGPRIVASMGVTEVDGRRAVVEVLIRVPPGTEPHATLAGSAARVVREDPRSGTTFATFFGGATWQQFADPPRQGAVVQHYNPTGDPTTGGGLEALLAAQRTWSAVRSSAFGFEFGGTTTRCPSLFSECGDEWHLDGFSDVGWVLLDPDGAVLGAAFVVIDVDNHILEGDVSLNTGADWSTEAQGFDLRSIVLHELGHVAGLDHDVFDPTAVMFPLIPPGFVQRQLAESDVEGITFLYPKSGQVHPGHPIQPPTPISATVVAVIDDPRPGEDLYQAFTGSDLNDAGEATYVVVRSAILGDEHAETVFRTGPGGALPLASTGGAAPGGGTFTGGANGRPTVDAAGQVAFAFDLEPLSFPIGLNSALVQSTAAGTSIVVRPGVTPAPSGGLFLGAADGQAGDGGDVVFTGIVETPPGPFGTLSRGVYRVRPDGTTETVAAPGDPVAGGGTLDFASFPSTNLAGDVAFDAHLAGEPCAPFTARNPAFDISCAWGVFVRRAGSAMAEPIAVPVDVAPNGQHFRAASGPVINDRGDVLFAADAEVFGERPLTTSRGAGLYVSSGGVIRPVLQPGDPLPGGGHGRTTFRRPSTGGWDINDNGDAAFVGVPGFNAFGDSLFFDMYVYVDRGGHLRRVAGSGTRVQGVGTIAGIGTIVNTGDEDTSFATGIHVSIGKDEVLFPATLTDGRVVLLRTRF